MKLYYTQTPLTPRDIYLTQFGEEQCLPDYSFGPAIRNNFILHYVYSGKGELHSVNKTYHIEKGQLFIIYPGQSAYYKADGNEPWLYRWIEFNGSLAADIMSSAGFSDGSAVLCDSEGKIGDAIKQLVDAHGSSYEYMMSLLWYAFSVMVQNPADTKAQTHTEIYLTNAQNYIHSNLHKKLTVSEIADFLGISRNHLSRIFTKEKGMTIQQYIISTKLNTAAQYLKNRDLTIKEIAYSVGYSDPLEFSKAFKKHFTLSPSKWRSKDFWRQSVKEWPDNY